MGSFLPPWMGQAGQGVGALGSKFGNPIYDFLRRMMMQQAGQVTGPGGGVPLPAPMPSPAAPAPVAPVVTGPAIDRFAAPPAPGSSAQLAQQFGPGGSGMNIHPTATTKTEPQAPLSFAWGRGTPAPYGPEVDILKMQGAPAQRGGFMGVPGGSGPGAVSGGERYGEPTDWSKVANPMGFEAFRERPLMAEYERSLKDPLWKEREQARMEQDKGVAIAQAQASAQANAIEQANDRLNQRIQAEARTYIADDNARRAREGKPPLSLQEEQPYYDLARMRNGQPLAKL
jgi:hypothetical protein